MKTRFRLYRLEGFGLVGSALFAAVRRDRIRDLLGYVLFVSTLVAGIKAVDVVLAAF